MLDLPPILRAVTLELAPNSALLPEASRLAAEGADPGTVFWRPSDRVAEAALVLAPDLPFREALQGVYVAGLGLIDSLGALVPSMIGVTLDWPDGVWFDGGKVGQIYLAGPADCGAESVPEWLVIGYALRLTGEAETDVEPGRRPDETTFYEEGCGDITSQAIVEKFGRHVLTWINRWQDDGFEPLRQAWMFRGPEAGSAVDRDDQNGHLSGLFDGLDKSGSLLLKVGGEQRVVDLRSALTLWPDHEPHDE